jgi:uncharacterized protein (DUF362 family)
VIRVGLARTHPNYATLEPPYGPGKNYPELAALLGDASAGGPPNHVYAAVRAALRGLGLDARRFDTPQWNPLAELVHRGGRVVLKPNFIRHWNPLEGRGGTTASLVTHGSVLRAVADYAFLAVGAEGSVAIAEAPQQDCEFERIREIAALDALVGFYEEILRQELEVIDLRREAVVFQDGIVVERRPLPGDPLGYRAVDLGRLSFFHASELDPERLRGADYDPAPTAEHHRDGKNEYLLSETVLAADLVVNLPKLKTHKKTGVTLALKNLVGINGDKNWLPHHCVGAPASGGDEFPENRIVDRWRSRATELARPWLARGRAVQLLRFARRLENAARGDAFIRAGNWWGNRTTWRMCLDLNRSLYYSDRAGLHLDAPAPVRRVLTVLDGVVAGEGEGPLAPQDRRLGVVLAATDPVALDLAALRLMGFDERRIPKVWEAMRDRGPRITGVQKPADVTVVELSGTPFQEQERRLAAIGAESPFLAHPGWSGHIERGGA